MHADTLESPADMHKKRVCKKRGCSHAVTKGPYCNTHIDRVRCVWKDCPRTPVDDLECCAEHTQAGRYLLALVAYTLNTEL